MAESKYLEKAAQGVLEHLPDEDAQVMRDWLQVHAHRAVERVKARNAAGDRVLAFLIVVAIALVVVSGVAFVVADGRRNIASVDCDRRVGAVEAELLECLRERP